MKLTYLGLPYEGKEDPSDLESGHPALAPGDTPNGLLLHATAYPGLALEEDASDGLGEAGKVLLEVGQLGGVDFVWARTVAVLLCLGLLYSLLLLCSVDRRVQGYRVLEGSDYDSVLVHHFLA